MNSHFLRSQDADLWTLEGIIVIPSYNYFPDSVPKPRIPQDVLLIPCQLGNKYERDQRVASCLADQTEYGYMIYFQSIRWTQPKVQDSLLLAWRTDITIKNIHGPKLNSFSPIESTTVLIAGKITFDRKSNPHREWVDDTEVYQLSISKNEKLYLIQYVECPGGFGVPKLFTPVYD